jgi:crotonobetainyl-CoA:carnitine CoA-transferase CaiB-like acyl-CoA transferase
MQLITAVDDADLGPIRMQNVMWRMGRTPGRIRTTGRALGADSEEILEGELGLAPEDVKELRNREIVA